MAVTTFKVIDVQFGVTVSGPQRTADSGSPELEYCIIDIVPTPNDGSQTYAQGNGSQVLTLGAAIAGIARDGRTYTPVSGSAACVGLGSEGASTLNAGAMTFAMSTTTFTFHVTTGALQTATEHANAALGVYTDGIKILIAYVKS
jgi:hypothetical protein